MQPTRYSVRNIVAQRAEAQRLRKVKQVDDGQLQRLMSDLNSTEDAAFSPLLSPQRLQTFARFFREFVTRYELVQSMPLTYFHQIKFPENQMGTRVKTLTYQKVHVYVPRTLQEKAAIGNVASNVYTYYTNKFSGVFEHKKTSHKIAAMTRDYILSSAVDFLREIGVSITISHRDETLYTSYEFNEQTFAEEEMATHFPCQFCLGFAHLRLDQ